MILLERYIAKNVVAAIALITFVLSGLQIFILFIKQIQDVGNNGFGIWEAIIFVFLQMPYQVYHFFPIVSLLGALLGLGLLANHSELVVMRASGMSMLQIFFAVIKVALIIIVIVTLVGETIIPKMSAYATLRKMDVLSGGQALRTKSGIWLRQHNDFIFIESIKDDNSLKNVFQFHFNDQHELTWSRQIKSVHFQQGQWQAQGIAETALTGSTIKRQKLDTMPWGINIQPALLKLSTASPDAMTLLELQDYLYEKKQNHQTAVNFQLAYFQRLLQPLATVVMMLLAIPFIFGPLRSSTMGSKFLMGASVGFTFYILNQLFNLIGQIYQLAPILAVPTPILLFSLIGLFMMQRAR